MIVVDASVVADLLILAGRDRKLSRLFLSQAGETFAPELIDLEVTQVLRRWTQRRALSPERASVCIAVLRDLPIKRQSHRAFLQRIWQLRNSLSAYDAAYVALAEGLDAPLFTHCEKCSSLTPCCNPMPTRGRAGR